MAFKCLPIRDLSKSICTVNILLDDENNEDDLEKKETNESKDFIVLSIPYLISYNSTPTNVVSVYNIVNDLQLYNIPSEITTPPPNA